MIAGASRRCGETMLAYLYLIFAVGFRLLPHAWWNFTPVGASLLFFGAHQPRRRMWVPVAALAVSDVLLTRYIYHMHLDVSFFVILAWYAAAVLIGGSVLRRITLVRVVGASLACSVSFFLISNFAVWIGGTLYPNTLAGLGLCYTAAVPFFRYTLAGDAIFSAVMFGLPAAAAMFARGRLRSAA
jgi:hypothetical protein